MEMIINIIKQNWIIELITILVTSTVLILLGRQYKNPTVLYLETKLKWLISELIAIYSNRDSYFSKKRLESGVAFIVAEVGLVKYGFQHFSTMSIQDISIWSAINLGIAGYTLNKIQQEKKMVTTDTGSSDTQKVEIN